MDNNDEQYCSSASGLFTTFTKDVRWSPDGSCILTADDADSLYLFEVPGPNTLDWMPTLKAQEGETIYDYSWYPLMNSSDPATCCFASSSRDHPLHLFDAFTGALRASYRGYDHLDEIVAAFSCCFTADGDKLVGGYNRAIRIFDVAVPGKSCTTISTAATRRSKDGQRGMMSALAASPDGGILAAGSYRGSLHLYDLRTGRAEMAMEGAMGGVTQVKFSVDGRYLFSGSRRGPTAEHSYVQVLVLFSRRFLAY